MWWKFWGERNVWTKWWKRWTKCLELVAQSRLRRSRTEALKPPQTRYHQFEIAYFPCTKQKWECSTQKMEILLQLKREGKYAKKTSAEIYCVQWTYRHRVATNYSATRSVHRKVFRFLSLQLYYTKPESVILHSVFFMDFSKVVWQQCISSEKIFEIWVSPSAHAMMRLLEMAWAAEMAVNGRFSWAGQPPKHLFFSSVPLRSAHFYEELSRMLSKLFSIT